MQTFFCLFWIALSFFGCTRTPDTNPNDWIRIGEVDSMTGNEATFGVDTHRGIQLAVDEINESGGIQGKKLKLFVADAQGRPDEAARAFSQLISKEKVVAILTGAPSSGALAMAPVAEKLAVPLIATAATAPKLTELGKAVYRVCFIDSFQGQMLAEFAAKELKWKRVALLRDIKSDYSIGLADVFKSTFLASGGEIVADQSYSGGDMDFTSQLTSLRTKEPDGILVPGYYTDVSLIARQKQSLGFEVPLLGGDGWDSPKLKEIAGNSLAGSYYSNFYSPGDQNERVQNFVTRFKSRFRMEPNGSSAMGYEALHFLAAGLKKAESLTPEQIQKSLLTLKNVPSLHGMLTLDEKRNAQKALVMIRIDEAGHSSYHKTMQLPAKR